MKEKQISRYIHHQKTIDRKKNTDFYFLFSYLLAAGFAVFSLFSTDLSDANVCVYTNFYSSFSYTHMFCAHKLWVYYSFVDQWKINKKRKDNNSNFLWFFFLSSFLERKKAIDVFVSFRSSWNAYIKFSVFKKKNYYEFVSLFLDF